MFCKHKYGKIEDGYQYCTKCNKAIVVPCNHKYRRIDAQKVVKTSAMGRKESIEYTSECIKCGDIKVTEI